ncbi:hypothetical protein PR202_ga28360 [Eleusine coracana subsp. coracana]|uniref:Major facilitator superfamily (MFS) profile domain-containing protein n=1 Tax=Eleusine coracana subsp. coracana TaxID=191504 RepID=A0AAV5DIH3_ELECO|nr:hypothetical protein PR202_ga28360 [Eleusine coracana subsp. coracana]
MEGGVHEFDGSTFKECFSLSWRNPYVLRLAFSAGIGGVISGALLYIRDDFRSVDKNTWLQELIVSMAVAGAIVGAAVGGWTTDRFGRRASILVADALFFAGAVVMASAPAPAQLVAGRALVGVGVGMASMTAPLYISEASPARVRGALVSTNGFLITGGQFLSYLVNLAFTRAPGTWRWMLGVAGVPAVVQFALMIFLPESPRWLYRKGRAEEAEAILRRVYSAEEADREISELKESVAAEQLDRATKLTLTTILKTPTVRRALVAGVGLQVFQQLVGINTVMYYSPSIVQLAGYASNSTALALSLVTSGLNALGSVVSIYFIDRTGRKKLLVVSLVGVAISLAVLTAVFHEAAAHSPAVTAAATAQFDAALACPAYESSLAAGNGEFWDCTRCLNKACGFCSSGEGNKLLPGACLAAWNTSMAGDNCKEEEERRMWYTRGCPSAYGWVALVGLAMYIVFFSPGMGTVPWIVNSEIYPLRFRGKCGGAAATANWVANLAVAQSFLSLTEAIGAAWTFLIFGGLSVLALGFVLVCVPETKGLPIEEVEKMLQNRDIRLRFWAKRHHSNDTSKPSGGV